MKYASLSRQALEPRFSYCALFRRAAARRFSRRLRRTRPRLSSIIRARATARYFTPVKSRQRQHFGLFRPRSQNFKRAREYTPYRRLELHTGTDATINSMAATHALHFLALASASLCRAHGHGGGLQTSRSRGRIKAF